MPGPENGLPSACYIRSGLSSTQAKAKEILLVLSQPLCRGLREGQSRHQDANPELKEPQNTNRWGCSGTHHTLNPV